MITATWTGRAYGLAEPFERITAHVEYFERDPLVVSVLFCAASGDVPWDIGRDLFVEALRDAHAGVGDVRIKVAPLSRQVWLTLDGLTGRALVSFPLEEVEDFIQATAEAVVPGQERVEVDRAIRKILKDVT